jgi:predicted lipoprotein with Yx(FWY)xxD motif
LNTRRFRLGLTVSGMALASAGLLAACGGSGTGGYGSSGSGSSNGSSNSGNTTIMTRSTSGVGTVLTDGSGKTLYTPEQEASGKIVCTGACVGFWFPALSSSAKVSSKANLPGKLATVKRPDSGKLQVTYNGMPLYTFKLDSGPGSTKGNDFSDSFGSTKFTWFAMTTKGSAKSNSSSSTTPSSSSSNGGGYGY